MRFAFSRPAALAAATVVPQPNVSVVTRGQSHRDLRQRLHGPRSKPSYAPAKRSRGDKGTKLDAVLAANPGAAPAPVSASQTTTPRPDCAPGRHTDRDPDRDPRPSRSSFPQTRPCRTGDYLIFLTQNDQEIAVPGALRILTDDRGKITLESISPTTIYPDEEQKGQLRQNFEFAISGPESSVKSQRQHSNQFKSRPDCRWNRPGMQRIPYFS